jgi:signal transduction histidine kinase
MEMSANISEVRALESHLTSLGLLIGSISHALKGLLNGLAGGMYLLDTGFQKDKPDRVQQGWEIIQRNVGRIKATVSDILYYAKDREPIWETVSAADLAQEVCNLMHARAAEHHIELHCETAPTAGDFEADPQAVRSLLINLLENSMDACRLDNKKSTHEVTLRLDGFPDCVQFGVLDNGIGMDQETREKAFSLFFSSKGMEGTGLGLFIANRIAQAHGGSIELDSQVGVGTQFVVKLPRKRPGEGDSPRLPERPSGCLAQMGTVPFSGPEDSHPSQEKETLNA